MNDIEKYVKKSLVMNIHVNGLMLKSKNAQEAHEAIRLPKLKLIIMIN